MRDPQPAVARPDVLPHADDAAAWIRLHWTRDQEPGPPFHAIKTFSPSHPPVNGNNLQVCYMQTVAGHFVCLFSEQIK